MVKFGLNCLLYMQMLALYKPSLAAEGESQVANLQQKESVKINQAGSGVSMSANSFPWDR